MKDILIAYIQTDTPPPQISSEGCIFFEDLLPNCTYLSESYETVLLLVLLLLHLIISHSHRVNLTIGKK
jgi:hypothetical protein